MRSASRYAVIQNGCMYMRVQYQLLIMFAFYAWITQKAHGLESKHPMYSLQLNLPFLSIRASNCGGYHSDTSQNERSLLSLPHPGPPTLQNERVGEGRLPLYNLKSFYPVKPGEISGD